MIRTLQNSSKSAVFPDGGKMIVKTISISSISQKSNSFLFFMTPHLLHRTKTVCARSIVQLRLFLSLHAPSVYSSLQILGFPPDFFSLYHLAMPLSFYFSLILPLVSLPPSSAWNEIVLLPWISVFHQKRIYPAIFFFRKYPFSIIRICLTG